MEIRDPLLDTLNSNHKRHITAKTNIQHLTNKINTTLINIF